MHLVLSSMLTSNRTLELPQSKVKKNNLLTLESQRIHFENSTKHVTHDI